MIALSGLQKSFPTDAPCDVWNASVISGGSREGLGGPEGLGLPLFGVKKVAEGRKADRCTHTQDRKSLV